MTSQELFNYIVPRSNVMRAAEIMYPGITADDFSVRCDDGVNYYVDIWNTAFGPKPTVDEILAVVPIVYAQIKREEINEARDKEEKLGFNYLDRRFDSDHEALRRISVAVMSAQAAISNGTPEAFSIIWTCQDNSTITLDAFQMVSMPVAMAQHGAAIHYYASDLKNQIESIKQQYINQEIDMPTAANMMEAIVWAFQEQ